MEAQDDKVAFQFEMFRHSLGGSLAENLGPFCDPHAVAEPLQQLIRESLQMHSCTWQLVLCQDLFAAFQDAKLSEDMIWRPSQDAFVEACFVAVDLQKQHQDELAGVWGLLSTRCHQRLSERIPFLTGWRLVRRWGESFGNPNAMANLLQDVMVPFVSQQNDQPVLTVLLPKPFAEHPTTGTPLPARSSAELAGVLEKLDALAQQQQDVLELLKSQRTIKDFYTTEEVAKFLNKSEYTVREWCRLGRVTGQKQTSGRGRTQNWVISHAELQRFQREGLLPEKCGPSRKNSSKNS